MLIFMKIFTKKHNSNPKCTYMKLLFSATFLFLYQNSFCLPIPNKKIDSVAIYTLNGDFQKGLHYSKKQSNYFLKQKKYSELCAVIIQQANIYNLLGDNENALGVLFSTLKIIQNKNKNADEIVLLKKIGEIYILVKDFKNAKNNLYKALTKTKKTKNDSLSNRINQSLFKAHMLSKSDSSLHYLKKVNRYFEKIGDDLSKYILYGNNFNYYIAKGNFKLAKLSIDSCVFYAKKSKCNDRILLALGNLVYNQVEVEGDYKKGKETYKEIFKTAKDTTSSRMAEHYFSYGNVLNYLEDYEEANKYLVKSIYIKDSLYKKNISSAVRDIETKYKIEKIEKEYKEKQHLLIKERSKNKIIDIAIASLFIIIIILFYFFFQITQLKQKNKLKDLQSQTQNNIINASINGQELERKKISEVLHDNISSLLSSAGLHLNVFDSLNQSPSEEIIKTKALLQEAHNKVRDLSHELMPSLLARFGLFYALEDLCEKNSNSKIHFEYSSAVNTNTRYNEEFEMKLYFITSELLNNIIKHSQANIAKVRVSVNKNQLDIQVYDNGKGFDSKKSNRNDGFGISQIKARIANLKGEISIISAPDLGATIILKVPILNK